MVELATASAGSVILVLVFSSVLVLGRRQSSRTMEQVKIQQDVMVLERYIRDHLIGCASDSVSIYADALAEQSGSPSSSGTILRAQSADGDSYRIATSTQSLIWTVDGVNHEPVESRVLDLDFVEFTSSCGKRVRMGLQLLFQEDTLAYEWVIAFRN